MVITGKNFISYGQKCRAVTRCVSLKGNKILGRISVSLSVSPAVSLVSVTRRSNTVTEKMVMVTTEIYRNVSLAVLYMKWLNVCNEFCYGNNMIIGIIQLYPLIINMFIF